MATFREYVQKNLSAIVARSKLGVKLRPIVQSALLPALGDKEMADLTPEAITAYGEARMKEPKKDGSPRSQASVYEEMDALEQIVTHFNGGKIASGGKSTAGGSDGHVHAREGAKSKPQTRGTQRGS